MASADGIVIIHVGAPKTGTSSIQNFMLTNQDRLERDYDVSFPILDPTFERPFANGSVLLNEGLWPNLESGICANTSRTIVLSEEVVFINNAFSRIAAAPLGGRKIKVIAYLRNAADYLASLWVEFNKLENRVTPGPLDDFLRCDFYLSSLHTLYKFALDNPQIDVICRPYEKAKLKDGDIRHDFAAIVGIDDISGLVQPDHSNYSVSRKAADVLQELHQAGIPKAADYNLQLANSIVNRLLPSVSGDDRSTIETIDDETIAMIAEKHRSILDRLLARTSDVRINHFPACFGVDRPAYQPLGAMPPLP